jgi:hypothetical protein
MLKSRILSGGIVAALVIFGMSFFAFPLVGNVAASTTDTCGSPGNIISCTIRSTPSSAAQNSGFTIKTSDTPTEMAVTPLYFIAVVTPGNVVYACGPLMPAVS